MPVEYYVNGRPAYVLRRGSFKGFPVSTQLFKNARVRVLGVEWEPGDR